MLYNMFWMKNKRFCIFDTIFNIKGTILEVDKYGKGYLCIG